MNRWELEQKIVIQALKDPAFKKKLMDQPNETVRDFLKNEKDFNPSQLDKLNIRIVEEKKEEWVLALPHLTSDMATLSDEQLLSMVAGGSLRSQTCNPSGVCGQEE